jgi:hypothetical protein
MVMELEDKIIEMAISYNMSKERVIAFAINFLYLTSKVPEYKIAFIDKNGKIVTPVNLEDI